MRDQTIPRLKAQTGLLPGMLKRTKYSRLRNDSLTSTEDHPQRQLPLERDLCFESDFGRGDAGSPTHSGSSTLRDFIPRIANIRLQSPTSLQGPRVETNATRDRTIDGHTDKPLCRKDWCAIPGDRFFSHSSLNVSLSTGQNLIHPALLCSKRPITLHRMASLPCPPSSKRRDGLCSLKNPSAVDDFTVARTANRAVHHHIKYMGSVEVTQSMRTLDFDTRIQVTREAISRLCERTSMKTAVKNKRTPSKGLPAVLGKINMQFSGSRVILTVSTDSMTLITASSLQRIAHHPMQAISFASGGDPDMAEYIAYVAKDFVNQRACHILECPQGRANEVISSIGQAFETCFRQLLSQTSTLLSPRSSVRICPKWCSEETATDRKPKIEGEVSSHRVYYNIIPSKTAPPGGKEDPQVTWTENKQHSNTQEVRLSPPVSLYENCSIAEETSASYAAKSGAGADQLSSLSETQVQNLIQEEGWFHGRLAREQAESLLTCSGDFLVRESSSACGQYVLSGVEGGAVRHILLVDPHGQVRTRDQVFQSVGHLVRFHMEKQLPIISGSSELCLKQPILQTH
ncbi:SHC-transforming protein 1-like [Cololabis saira]|uniref:SHC-transforming protein 1-like n=1 Tax=Cololabis saira TaxID=129043 RepID=UPI002AD4EF48|nr:SHC-transforming protein 1-like [Cololabis saira]